MIKINRTTAPSVLSNTTPQIRYNLPPVVRELWTMQREKCCYCEQYIPDCGLGKHVEHFWPRHPYCDLKNAWKNLLLACPICNGAKSNKFPFTEDGTPLLLDPSDSSIDPEEHIDFMMGNEPIFRQLGQRASVFSKGMAVAKDQSQRGNATIGTIGLSSIEHHLKRRGEVIRNLEECLRLLICELKKVKVGNGDATEVENQKQCLLGAMEGHREYAGVARAFSRKYRLTTRGIIP